MNEFFAVYRVRAAVLLGFPVGVSVVQWLPELPRWPVVLALILAVLVAARLRWRFMACACAGATWALVYVLFRMADALPFELEKADVTVEGIVASIPDVQEGETRFHFDVCRVVEPSGVIIPRHIRLAWYRNSTVPRAGERWRLAVRLKRPRGMMNPGGMDYELWLLTQNIRATGYVREGSGNVLLDRNASWFDVESWRQTVYDRLQRLLGERPFAGVLAALAMGTEGGITTEQWDVLRQTGTTHLVAISGSHIALIAGWCFFPARWIACRLMPRRSWPPGIAVMTSLAAAVLYSALAGFAIPTQRALIMIAIVTGGIIGRRQLQPLHTLGLALLAVLIYDPLAILAPGFWLSYAAVGLIWFTMAHRLAPGGHFSTLWRINWAMAVGLAPLLLLFFGQVPLVSPLANLLAVPVIGLVVIPLALVGTLLMWVSDFPARWVFDLAEYLLGWTWQALEALAAPSSLIWSQAQPPLWAVPLALLGAGVLLAPRGVPGRWLGLLLMLPALKPELPSLPPGAFELTVLDVGQGSAAVVHTRHRTLVFDTGARFSQRFDMGAVVIVPFLRHAGVGRVDTLVVSHGDNDHSGGTASLLRLMPVGLIYSSVPEQLPSNRAVSCRAGQDWRWDGVHFTFLSPENQSGNDNDLSCVLRVAAGNHRVLLTGDIERLAEARLVERYGSDLRSDVLIVPHHGSNTSSTQEFLQQVRPRYALISAAYRNRFGFPHANVVTRLNAVAATVLTTAQEGAITARFSAGEELDHPVSYRRTHRRYWMADAQQ